MTTRPPSSSSSHRREADQHQPRAPRRSSDIINERRGPPREIRSKRRSSSSRNPPPSSTDRGALSSHAQRDRSKPRPHPSRAAKEEEWRDHPGDEKERRRGHDHNDRLSKQGFVGATSVRGMSVAKKDPDDDPEYGENVRMAIASEVDMDFSMASNNPVYQATEFDPSKKPRALEISKRKNMRKYGVIGMLLSGAIALIVVIVVIVVQRNKNKTGAELSLVPTLSPTFQRETCIAARIESALLSDLSVLDDPTSPQSKARDWILYDDPAGLVDCTSSNLIQRWALATFYFATTKDNNTQWLGCAPTVDPIDTDCIGYTLTDELRGTPRKDRTYTQDIIDQKQWLKHANECLWYGAYCGDGNDVSELILCKFIDHFVFQTLSIMLKLFSICSVVFLCPDE
jgi:hypothetical protein